MEVLVAALLVVVVIEAMVIYRFKRRADLLKETMERDRAVFTREGHPRPPGRPPEPVVGRTPERPPGPSEAPGRTEDRKDASEADSGREERRARSEAENGGEDVEARD